MDPLTGPLVTLAHDSGRNLRPLRFVLRSRDRNQPPVPGLELPPVTWWSIAMITS